MDYGVLRGLSRSPRFTVLFVLTLTLGIAANVAVFSIAYTFLYRPPALIPDASRLLTVSVHGGSRDSSAGGVSYRDYERLKAGAASSLALTAYGRQWANARVGADAVRVSMVLASGNFFDVLGVMPSAGRVLMPIEDQPGHAPASVISEEFVDRYGPEALAVGRPLAVNGVWTTIVGVMPRRFRGLEDQPVDVWVGLGLMDEVLRTAGSKTDIRNDSDSRWLNLVGRLRQESTARQAEIQLTAATVRPEGARDGRARVVLGRRVGVLATDRDRATAGALSAILQCAVGVLVFIAIVNAASLSFSESLARRRDLAIRVALGCSRKRLLTGLLAEALLMGIIACGASVVVSSALLHVFVAYLSPESLRDVLNDVSVVEWPVLAGAAGLSAAASIVAALAPALRITSAACAGTLRTLDSTVVGGLARTRGSFVVFQVALAVSLLLTVGLLIQARRNVQSTPSGLNTKGVFVGKVEPRRLGYDADQTALLTGQLFDALGHLPGVEGVAFARSAPLQSNGWAHGVVLESHRGDNSGADMVDFNVVSSNYFDFFGIPCVDGRVFAASDDERGARVMVINETFARTWWPGRQAVGSQLRLSGEPSPRTVVGVVRDVKYTGLQRPAGSYFYLPLSQPNPLAQVELTVQVRPRVPPAQAEAAIRRVVSGIDPNLAFFGFGTVDSQVDRELIQQTLLASFIGLVGLLALILVGLGLNATVSETVSQARREIAIRLALGATHLGVQAGIAGRILRQVSYGLLIGLGVGSLVAMALSSVLVGASTTDPLLVLSVAALVVLITGVGVTGQLWRLRRLDPGRLLRET